MDILDLLRRSEGKTLEFKRDLSSSRGILRTLVAFANTAGGILLVGVEDETRSVLGVVDPLELEEQLANMISDGISPRMVPEIEILTWNQRHLLGVQVYPSPNRPHFVVREGLERGTYVRVGSTNRCADVELIEAMRRVGRAQAFDEQPMPDLDSEAVDFRAASESFANVRRLERRDLETLRLTTAHQGRKVPTVGGILLFGRRRETYFPDAWIQAGRFRGVDKAHIDDHREIRSYLPQAVEEAIGFVDKHMSHAMDIGMVRRTVRTNLPPLAVRETIINAVAHADYAQKGAPIRIAIFDDRLEVENPGLLPLGLTVEDLKRGISKLRNRVIGRVFHELGLIEQWGSGIQRILSSCREAGLGEPLFEELANRFRVTIYLAEQQRVKRDEKDQRILRLLGSSDGLGTGEIAESIGLSPRATRTRLARLVSLGLVREIGSNVRDPRRKYYTSR